MKPRKRLQRPHLGRLDWLVFHEFVCNFPVELHIVLKSSSGLMGKELTNWAFTFDRVILAY